MKTAVVARTAVQTVSVAFGLLGLSWVCIGVYFGVTSIRDSDWSLAVSVSAYSLIIGLLAIDITRRILWHFSSAAIKDLVGVVAFLLYGTIAGYLYHFIGPMPNSPGLHGLVMALAPICLAVLLYRVVSRVLIQLTGKAE